MMKTNFSVTCNLLSQFIKQKGSLTDMAAVVPLCHDSKGTRRPPPTTLCLLPGVDVSEDDGEPIVADIAAGHAAMDSDDPPARSDGDNSPLTIFYGGKVMVFDNFPAKKAVDLMKLAGEAAAKTVELPAAAAAAGVPIPQARRASLHRFLEKRKDRILAMAPYKVKDTSSPAPAKAAEELPAWLALAARSSSAAAAERRR